jgi:succinate dehydrogenase flavin-adding protein (antitoxin of CptAB toxin-antitoxin module)
MQSDGKSSFVEALLGFQFNMVDTNIGTRRPLILQMHNDSSHEKPHCLFWDQDLKGENLKPTLVKDLEGEIKRRTDEVCGPDGVSSIPIILNIHYKYCANLTIIDTPGFRKGDNDPLGAKIEKMVMNLLKAKERVIVCLEQSTVEWCNSQVRPMIQRVDPNFARTVIVSTKFNNRNNQFRDREEVDKYLSTDSQIKNPKQVFFISLPSGHGTRDLREEEFKDKILEIYLQDYKLLSKIGFDQEKYKPQLGFFNLKRYLECMLNERYRIVLGPIVEKVQQTIEKKLKYKERLEAELQTIATADLEEQANNIVSDYLKLLKKTLNGTNMFNTDKNGQTLAEEREKSDCPNWPNFDLDIKVRNSQFKLYGGSQLERLLAEFEVVAHSQEFPPTADDEVAVTIGLNSMHTIPDYDRGASELAQKKCKAVFKPLVDILLARSRYLMKQTFRMILKHQHDESPSCRKFKQLLKELQIICEQFLEKVLHDVRGKTDTEFDTFTRVMDWDLMNFGSSKQLMEYDLLNPTKEDTMKRVQLTIDESSAEKMQFFSSDRSRELTEERCKKIKEVSARLFAGVRLLFVKYVRAKFNAFFLDPFFSSLENQVQQHFKKLGTEKIMQMAAGPNPATIKQNMDSIASAVEKLIEQKEKLIVLHQKFQSMSLKTTTTANGRAH